MVWANKHETPFCSNVHAIADNCAALLLVGSHCVSLGYRSAAQDLVSDKVVSFPRVCLSLNAYIALTLSQTSIDTADCPDERKQCIRDARCGRYGFIDSAA